MLAILLFGLCGVLLGVLLNAGYELLRSIVIRIRKRRTGVSSRAGLSPIAHDARTEAMIAQPGLITESKPVEHRLAQLDDLCQRGIISDSERAEARVRVLAAG